MAPYKQTFRKEWKDAPEFRDWLGGTEGEEAATCKFCHVEVRTHFGDLKKHAKTEKHRKAAASYTVPKLTTTSISSDYYSKAIEESYQNELFTDLDIVAGDGGNGVKCHALVLASLFPLIKESLRGREDMEVDSHVVILPDFSTDEVKGFVDGVYKRIRGKGPTRRSHGQLEALLARAVKQSPQITKVIEVPEAIVKQPEEPKQRKRGRPSRKRAPENGLSESEPPAKRKVGRPRKSKKDSFEKDKTTPGGEEGSLGSEKKNSPKTRAEMNKKRPSGVKKAEPASVNTKKPSQELIGQMRRICRGCISDASLEISSDDLCKSASCNNCELEFKGHNWLLNHYKSKHEGAWVIISSESRKEKREQKLQAQQEGEPSSKRSLCNDCGKTFATAGSLKTHINIVHKRILPYKCKFCVKAFYSSHHLQTHVNSIHKRLKQFLCTECGRGFVLMQHLTRHIKIVHQKIKYECHICQKALATVTGLKTHIESIHSGSGGVRCEVCGQTLAHSVALRAHIKRRHPEAGAFRCLECNRGFLTENMLKIHTTQHHKVTITGDVLALATTEIGL